MIQTIKIHVEIGLLQKVQIFKMVSKMAAILKQNSTLLQLITFSDSFQQ